MASSLAGSSSSIAMATLALFLIFVTLVCSFASLSTFHLPTLHKLGSASLSRCSDPDQGDSPPPPEFRLFIGVLTQADQYWRRNILRLAYGTQSPPVAAHVDVKYIFCGLTKEDQTVLVALEILRYDDIIILNCTENMDSGKTYTYFSSLPDLLAAGNGSRPYDYVMKADDDTYFRVNPLVESLRNLSREDLYYGFTIPCHEMNPFKHYMSGMGYLLSWDLVEWIAASEVPKNHTVGPEDRLVGDWLEMGGRGRNRYNAKPAMYDYPINAQKFKCWHEFIPETIAVHRLKSPAKWVDTLKYFNASEQLPPSKLYHID